MIRYTKHVYLVFAVLASVCTVGRSEEPQWPKRNLQFKVQTSEVIPGHPKMPSAVTYMAVVTIGPDRAVSNLNLDVSSNSPNGDPSQLLRTPAGQSMSEKQRELVGGKAYMVYYSGFSRRGGANEVRYGQYHLYAVSENDARKMAEALVELCDIKGHARLEGTRKDLDNDRKLIPETERKLTELDASIKAAEAECSELRKGVSYRNLDDAMQDVVELDKTLRSLQVEMAGIEAKVNAIKKLPQDPNATEWKDRMLATEGIELAGVLARKSVTQGHRNTAQQYCTVERRRLDDEKAKRSLIDKLKSLRQTVPVLEQTLADMPAHMKPLLVLDNEVPIHLVGSSTSSAPF